MRAGALCQRRVRRSATVEKTLPENRRQARFADLVASHDELLEAARGNGGTIRLQKNLADRAFSGLVGGLSKISPLATVLDSSPYDRAMRRIHNYMKDSESFRNDQSDYRQR